MTKLRIFVLHASTHPTDYLPHGDGLLAYRYITELAERGHELVVAIEDAAIRGPVPENITLINVAAKTGESRIAYMRNVRKIFKAEHAKRPFHLVHQLNPVFCGLSLALFGISIPIVLGPYVTSWPVTVTGKDQLKSMMIRSLRFLEQAQANTVILAGRQAASNVAYPGAKQRIIPYGVDTTMFAPCPPPTAAPPTIIWLGPIARRKGIIAFLQALPIICKAIPNVHIRIAGTGDEYAEVTALIAAYDLHSQVELLGSVPRNEVPQYIAGGHVLCQPSLGEPYGMSVIEAMAIGRPIVATAAGGFLDTVDSNGGILVPLDAPDALAAALIQILSDASLAHRMGTYNAAKAKTYAWSQVIDQLEDVYRDTVREIFYA